MGNISYVLIQPRKNHFVPGDIVERWHYKVFLLSPPDLQNHLRLNGYVKNIKIPFSLFRDTGSMINTTLHHLAGLPMG